MNNFDMSKLRTPLMIASFSILFVAFVLSTEFVIGGLVDNRNPLPFFRLLTVVVLLFPIPYLFVIDSIRNKLIKIPIPKYLGLILNPFLLLFVIVLFYMGILVGLSGILRDILAFLLVVSLPLSLVISSISLMKKGYKFLYFFLGFLTWYFALMLHVLFVQDLWFASNPILDGLTFVSGHIFAYPLQLIGLLREGAGKYSELFGVIILSTWLGLTFSHLIVNIKKTKMVSRKMASIALVILMILIYAVVISAVFGDLREQNDVCQMGIEYFFDCLYTPWGSLHSH